MKPIHFKNAATFRKWLELNHEIEDGKHIYIYKKGYHDRGMSYEEAVCTALCYGWIDGVTHRCDDEKFIQYFAPRRKGSNWSVSNIKRMKKMIEKGLMTDAGLNLFNMEWIDQLPELEKKDSSIPDIPEYFLRILNETHMLEAFESLTKGVQKRYLHYILDAKQMQTKLRRCHKVIGIMNGEKNNL